MDQGGDGTVLGADHSLIDFNRAGVPLIEIVSEVSARTNKQTNKQRALGSLSHLLRLDHCLCVCMCMSGSVG